MKKQLCTSLASLMLPLASYGGMISSGYYQRNTARPGFAEPALPGNNQLSGELVARERARVDDAEDLDIVPGPQARELLVIDEAVPDKATFYKALKPGVAVAEIGAGEDGLKQLRTILAEHQNLDAVHIVSHAEDGVVHLGNSRVTADSVKVDVELFAALNGSVKAGGDLLFYGCNLAATEKGEELLDIIAGNTQLDVAASNDLTGNSNQRGDWELEISRGNIDSNLAFSEKSLKDFSNVLATYTASSFCGSYCGPYSNITSADGLLTITASTEVFVDAAFAPGITDYSAVSGYAGGNSGWLEFSADGGQTTFQLNSLVLETDNGHYCDVSVTGYYYGGGSSTPTPTETISSGGGVATLNHNVSQLFGLDLSSIRVNLTNCSEAGFVAVTSLDASNFSAANDNDGSLSAASGVSEPVGLPSTADLVSEAMDVFDFTLSDGGTSDGLPMDVSEIRVKVSGTSTDAERSKIAWRLNGTNVSNVPGTYDAVTDIITFSGLNISVPNNGNETYTINAYYNDNTNLTEDHSIILSVDGDTDLTVGGSGTQMGATSAVTNGSGTTIDVVATQMAFTTQPAGSTSGNALSTQPVVAAQDAFGNTDVDFTETVTLTEASAGSLTNNAQAATAGVAAFTALTYTATADQESFTLTANDQDGVGTDLATVDANAVTSDVVATKLSFNTEPAPTSIVSGESTNFTTVPVVSAVDSQGVVDTGYSTGISLAVTDPNDGVVDGTVNSMTGTGDADGNGVTVTLSPSSGAATFTGLALRYTNAGLSEQIALRASSGGLTTADSITITSVANAAPSFDSGSSTPLNIDEGDGATSIDSLLAVTDTDSGDTLTWTVSSTPSKGTLGGFAASETADGGSVSPSGLTYAPDAEATGGDSFDIEVSDGSSTDVITINVDIDARPTVTLSPASGDPTNASPFDVTVTFSESVTGFTGGDVVVGNGSVSGVTGSGANYQVSVAPSADGAVTVDIGEGAAQDVTGKDSKAATQLSVSYDSAAPVPTLTSSAAGDTINAPVDVTVDFGETVSNFVVGDLVVTNGTLSGFADLGGGAFELTLTPSGAGEVTLSAPAGVAEDEAGNTNEASNTLTYTYDGTAPILQSTTPADSATDVPLDTALSFVFDETMVAGTGQITVKDLTDNDVHTTLSITDGQVSINGGQVTVTLATELVPTHEYAVQVAAGSLLDEAGNSWAGITNDTGLNFTVANEVPQAVNDTLTVTQGQSRAVDVLANDSDADGRLNPASVRVIDTPDHGRALVDTGSGTIRYVADSDYVGADSLTYVMEDEFGGASSAATLAITVKASEAPPVSRADSLTTAPGQSAMVDLLANDLAGPGGAALDPASVVLVNYPANGSAQVNGAGELTYTPDEGFTGTERLDYTVADVDGTRAAAAAVFLNSDSGNAAPVAADDTGTTGLDSQVVIDVLDNDSVSGGALDTATIEVTRAPRHGVLDLTATPGQVAYQPDSGFRGQDHFHYVVRSQAGVVSNAAEVTVSVAEDGAPVVMNDYVQRLDDATLAINVLGNDRGLSLALDPSTLTMVGGPGQGAVVLDAGDGVFRYTPDDSFSGTDTFTYTVEDLGGTLSQTATVTISDVAGDPVPLANDQYAFVPEDDDSTLSVLDNDQALGGGFDGSSLAIVEDPEQGKVTLDGSGNVLYTPDADAFGEDRFRYTVMDNNGVTTDPATVRLVINPQAEVPLISGTPEPTVPAGTRYRFTPVATDVDGKPLTFSITNLPSWASFDASNGRITGTPALGDVGATDDIVITVSNGEQSKSLEPFALRVTDNSGGSDEGGPDDPVSPVAPGDSDNSDRQVVDPSDPTLDAPTDGWPAYTNDQPSRARYELTYTDVNGVPRNVTVILDDASAPLPSTSTSGDGGQVLTFSQGSGDQQVIEIDPDGTTSLRQGSTSTLISEVIDLDVISFADGTLRSMAVIADGDDAGIRVVIDQSPTTGVTVSTTNTDADGNDMVTGLQFDVDGANISLAADGSVTVTGIPGGHEGIEYRIAADGSASVFGQFPDGSAGTLTSAITTRSPGSMGVVDSVGLTLMELLVEGSSIEGQLGANGELDYDDTDGNPASLPKGSSIVLEPTGGTPITVNADPDGNGLGRAAQISWGNNYLGRLEVTDLDAGNGNLFVERNTDGNGFTVTQSLSGLGELRSHLFLDGTSRHALTTGPGQLANEIIARVPFSVATRYSDRVTLVSDADESILLAELLADGTARHEVAAEGESTRARSNVPGTRTTLDTGNNGQQRVISRAATDGRSFTMRADANGAATHRNVNRSGVVTQATFAAPGTYTLLTEEGILRSQSRLDDGDRCAWVETFGNGETGTGYGHYDSDAVQCVGIDSPTSNETLFEPGTRVRVEDTDNGHSIVVETDLTRPLRF